MKAPASEILSAISKARRSVSRMERLSMLRRLRAAAFLVVDGVVLEVADDVLGLHAFDEVANEGSGEQRVIALVLEGAAIAWLARQVDAATRDML